MAMKELVKFREEVKKRKPEFRRYLADRIKKLSRSGYRRPKGIQNKMRKRIFGKPKMPCAGYGGPREARHLHPSGYREVLVYNPADLEKIDKENEAVRIASCVGTKKRLEILKKAEELGIKVLNPRIKRRAYLELKRREEEKEKKEKEKAEETKEEKAEKSEKKEEEKKVPEKKEKAEEPVAQQKEDKEGVEKSKEKTKEAKKGGKKKSTKPQKRSETSAKKGGKRSGRSSPASKTKKGEKS